VAENGADLKGFLEAAGRSLADAQGALAGDVADIPTAVAIAEAELEVKATMGGAPGTVVLQPVTSQDARQGAITPGMLSTVRIRYVAVTEDTLVAPSEQPLAGQTVEVAGDPRVTHGRPRCMCSTRRGLGCRRGTDSGGSDRAGSARRAAAARRHRGHH